MLSAAAVPQSRTARFRSPTRIISTTRLQRYWLGVALLLGIAFVLRWVGHRLGSATSNSSRSDSDLSHNNYPEHRKVGVLRSFGNMRVLKPWDDVTRYMSAPFVLRGRVPSWQGWGGWSLLCVEQVVSAMRNPFPTVRIDGTGTDMFDTSLSTLVAEARAAKENGIVPIYGVLTLDLAQRQEVWGNLGLPRALRDDLFLACLGRQDPRGKIAADFMDDFLWSQIFVGAEGSGMQMHRDNLRTHVWSAQLEGEKQMVACKGSKGSSAKQRATWQSKFSDVALIDAFRPIDHEHFPDFVSADCVWAAAEPGDLLFWPSNWYHQTLNANGTSIAVSGMALDGLVASEFLSGVRRHPGGTRPVRAAVKKCFRELRMI